MATFYAYIDEAGDEGFPTLSPHTDPAAYFSRHAKTNGPSPFFMICAVLVEDRVRAQSQKSVRELSRVLYPAALDKTLHWRDMDWERKEHAIAECCKLDFKWIAVVAYKPALPRLLKPPLLYNYCTKMLLERLCIHVNRKGGMLKPVFSNRSRTNYVDLQRYVSAEVDAFGSSHRLRPIATQQAQKERLLQLADICAGSLHNALEPNNYGNLQTQFFRTSVKKMCRGGNQRIWGCGFKIHPKEPGTNYGAATDLIEALRKM